MPMTVKDVMSKPVYTIDANKTAKDAAELMKKTRKGSLIVVKGNHPIGIVTADDLVYKIVSENKKASAKIKDIASAPLIVANPNESVSDISRKMRQNRVKRLPVVDNGKLVGIVSFTDIATMVPDFADFLEERMNMDTGEMQIREPSTSGICDNCDKYSDNLVMANDQWLCEDCREELKP
ncbi:CBS domain-containing protein [archaeon]|nr:MAG: CBS domain-containing protein [archaeon]